MFSRMKSCCNKFFFPSWPNEWIAENGEIPDGKVLVRRQGEPCLEDAMQRTTMAGFLARMGVIAAVVAVRLYLGG
jgi:hypothetical protein